MAHPVTNRQFIHNNDRGVRKNIRSANSTHRIRTNIEVTTASNVCPGGSHESPAHADESPVVPARKPHETRANIQATIGFNVFCTNDLNKVVRKDVFAVTV